MKNIEKYKWKIVIIFFGILIIQLTKILSTGVWADELWNFLNCYKVWNGYLMYKDANIIVTPMFTTVAQLFFFIFKPNMITFRIYDCVVNFILIVSVYKLFRKLEIRQTLAVIYSIFILFMQTILIGVGANYNIICLIFILLGINHKISKGKSRSYDVVQGLIIFFVFFSKQNMGVYYAIAIILNELNELKLSKLWFKKQIIKFIAFLIPTLIILSIMFANNILMEFIDICFLGMIEFGTKNLDFQNVLEIPIVPAILISCILLRVKGKKIDETYNKNNNFFVALTIMGILASYPIFNYYHLFYSIIMGLIWLMYMLDKQILNELITSKYDDIILKSTMYTILIVSLTACIITIPFVHRASKLFPSDSPYYMINVWEKEVKKIPKMTEYIKQKNNEGADVIIISPNSGWYTIPLKGNNGYFDVPNMGNFGIKGEDGLIDKIRKSKEGTQYLIFTEERFLHYQDAMRVRKYIQENFEKVGEIEEYTIYEK
jgi:hypothetical protein